MNETADTCVQLVFQEYYIEQKGAISNNLCNIVMMRVTEMNSILAVTMGKTEFDSKEETWASFLLMTIMTIIILYIYY